MRPEVHIDSLSRTLSGECDCSPFLPPKRSEKRVQTSSGVHFSCVRTEIPESSPWFRGFTVHDSVSSQQPSFSFLLTLSLAGGERPAGCPLIGSAPPIFSQLGTPLLLFLFLMKSNPSFKTQFKFLKVHNLFPVSITPWKFPFLLVCVPYIGNPLLLGVSSFEDHAVWCPGWQLCMRLRKLCILHLESFALEFANNELGIFRNLLSGD